MLITLYFKYTLQSDTFAEIMVNYNRQKYLSALKLDAV